jgi:hypothetical protein
MKVEGIRGTRKRTRAITSAQWRDEDDRALETLLKNGEDRNNYHENTRSFAGRYSVANSRTPIGDVADRLPKLRQRPSRTKVAYVTRGSTSYSAHMSLPFRTNTSKVTRANGPQRRMRS